MYMLIAGAAVTVALLCLRYYYVPRAVELRRLEAVGVSAYADNALHCHTHTLPCNALYTMQYLMYNNYKHCYTVYICVCTVYVSVLYCIYDPLLPFQHAALSTLTLRIAFAGSPLSGLARERMPLWSTSTV